MEGLGIEKFYQGKRVLLTGHSGFKGAWLANWLVLLGAEVVGLSDTPNSNPQALYHTSMLSSKITEVFVDIRDYDKLANTLKDYQPDLCFHLAAQALVRPSYLTPLETYTVNVMGTANLLEAIRQYKKPLTSVFITSDKCYENVNQLWGYRENDPMGGYDPYSSSKGCCELLLSSWTRSFFNPDSFNEHRKALASTRAGNVIGGGDFAADRIVPDMVRAMELEAPVRIRNPKAVRPWQHVLDCLWGYLLLCQKLHMNPTVFSGGWNFGPDMESCVTVQELTEHFLKCCGKGYVEYEQAQLHEAGFLMLDSTKARRLLGWKPVLPFAEALHFTAAHYMRQQTTEQQISEFMERAAHGVN